MAGFMQVILTEDIPKLGEAGEVVRVRAGFGRNFLLPQGKAMLATPGRVKQIEHQRRMVSEKQRKEMSVQEEVARGLATVDLAFEMQASSEGRLFGSVTNADIAGRLAEAGFQIDRRKIELAEPIKQVGDHSVSVRLHREVIAELAVKEHLFAQAGAADTRDLAGLFQGAVGFTPQPSLIFSLVDAKRSRGEREVGVVDAGHECGVAKLGSEAGTAAGEGHDEGQGQKQHDRGVVLHDKGFSGRTLGLA